MLEWIIMWLAWPFRWIRNRIWGNPEAERILVENMSQQIAVEIDDMIYEDALLQQDDEEHEAYPDDDEHIWKWDE